MKNVIDQAMTMSSRLFLFKENSNLFLFFVLDCTEHRAGIGLFPAKRSPMDGAFVCLLLPVAYPPAQRLSFLPAAGEVASPSPTLPCILSLPLILV